MKLLVLFTSIVYVPMGQDFLSDFKCEGVSARVRICACIICYGVWLNRFCATCLKLQNSV